jgi:3-oxoadipate enol-lactonase
MFADDVAGLMQAIGLEKAHVAGLSLGAATGMWLAAKHPDRVKSLSSAAVQGNLSKRSFTSPTQ